MKWLPDERAKKIAPDLIKKIKENQNFASLLENSGIMFGILICKSVSAMSDSCGESPAAKDFKILKAFSGQINGKWNVDESWEVDFGEKWCPPLLDEEKFNELIKDTDKKIHSLTDEIEKLESENPKMKNLGSSSAKGTILSADEKKIFQKILDLKNKRREMSKNSMKDIFSLYEVNCVQPGVEKKYSFSQIFGEKLPPTGIGECCAPKLLNQCAKLGLQPVSMCEFYLGKENKNENSDKIRSEGNFYPPCEEKCAPLMKYFLGLETKYFDENLIVVNKPSGLLSVPGRGPEKQDCVVNRVKFLFSEYMKIQQPSVHRLDMDTSGLLVLAFDEETHRDLNRQFEEKSVEKKYVAVLNGPINIIEQIDEKRKIKNIVTAKDEKGNPVEGIIELPFRLDPDHRPHQIFDSVYGKVGITKWKFLKEISLKEISLGGVVNGNAVSDTGTIVEFSPMTGRTHQLRLCSASKFGLGAPILGDDLYGKDCEMIDLKTFAADGSRIRLHLQAFFLRFVHPGTLSQCEFCCQREF